MAGHRLEGLRAEIGDAAALDEARRATVALARRAGLGKTRSAAVALVVRELGQTALDAGERIRLVVSPDPAGAGVDLTVLDGAQRPREILDDILAAAHRFDGPDGALWVRAWSDPNRDLRSRTSAIVQLGGGTRAAAGQLWTMTRGHRAPERHALVDCGPLGDSGAALEALQQVSTQPLASLDRVARLMGRALAGIPGAGFVLVDVDGETARAVAGTSGTVTAAGADILPSAWVMTAGAPTPVQVVPAQDAIVELPWGSDTKVVLAAGHQAADVEATLSRHALHLPSAPAAARIADALAPAQPGPTTVLVLTPPIIATESVTPLLSVPLRTPRDVRIALERARNAASAIGLEYEDEQAFADAVRLMAGGALERMGRTDLDLGLAGEAGDRRLAAIVADLASSGQDRAPWPDEQARGRVIRARPITPSTVLTTLTIPVPPSAAAALDQDAARAITAELRSAVTATELEQLPRTQIELARALRDLHVAQREVVHLRRELSDAREAINSLTSDLTQELTDAREGDVVRRRMLSALAHEVRTPLYAIQGLVELMTDISPEPLSEQQRSDLRQIDTSTRAALEIVDEQLALSRRVAGKPVVRLTDVEVVRLFSSLRGMVQTLPRARGVTLELVVPEPRLQVRTDVAKVTQILRNFISNALKFTLQGSVLVEARRVDDGRTIEFSVSDTGLGLAFDDQRRVFDEYQQVPGAHAGSRLGQGTGLGLPISRQLALLIGGEVGVRSVPGEGATFLLRLPLEPVDLSAEAEVIDLDALDV